MKYQTLVKSAVSGAIFAAAFTSSAEDTATTYDLNGTGGAWSDSSTWATGTVPTTTNLDTVKVSSDNANLIVDSDATLGYFDISSVNNFDVSIADGKTFTFGGAYAGESGDRNKKITFNGNGTLSFGVLKEALDNASSKASYVFNTKVKFALRDTWLQRSSFTFNNDVEFSGGQVVARGRTGDFYFNKGSVNVKNTHFNFVDCGSIYVGKDVNFFNTSNGQGAGFNNLTLEGTMTLYGERKGWGVRFATRFDGNTKFASTAVLKQMKGSTSDFRNIFSGNITVEDGADLQFAQAISFGRSWEDTVTLTLNGKNSIKTINSDGSVSGQGKTNFVLKRQKGVTGDGAATETLDYVKLNVTLNADNDFGVFQFYGDSVLTLDTNGKNVSIKGFEALTEELVSSSVNVYFKNLVDNTVRIYDKKGIELSEEGQSTNVFFYDADNNAMGVFLKDAGDGSYWINTTAVPEPATYAALFGLAAFALVLYRRRR